VETKMPKWQSKPAWLRLHAEQQFEEEKQNFFYIHKYG